MTQAERDRWDQRYAEGDYEPRAHPTPFLEDWLDRIPAGQGLDLATGTGRNALRLAEAGFRVTAVDVSSVAIDRARAEAERRGLEVDWRTADLDDLDLEGGAYDLITVIRYRNPDLWPRLIPALAPNGWVLVEHHLRSSADVGGPHDPAFRLEPGELLHAFGALRIVHYSEALEPADHPQAEGRTFAIARLVACKGDPGW